MRLLNGAQLADAIRRLLEEGGKPRCAVAFWGAGVAALAAARSAEVVLDVSMGGTSRNALRALGVPRSRRVRVLDRLHAKLYLSEEEVIIGSANASLNALGGPGREPFLEESGLLVSRAEHPAVHADAERLFRRYWNRGHPAGDGDIERAVRVSRLPPSRDASSDAAAGNSLLEAVRLDPERFSRAVFVFGDERVEIEDEKDAYRAYAGTEEAAADDRGVARTFICLTADRREDRTLQEGAYLVMYWFGEGAGIQAFHDIVRVAMADGSAAFFGRRQWSVVRSRLGYVSASRVAGVWSEDRLRAGRLANLGGAAAGGRFVIMPADEVSEALEVLEDGHAVG